MGTKDLHSALKNTVITDITEGGVHYKHVRLQQGKNAFIDTLHADPNSYTSAGIHMTDFLYYLGFRRYVCPFHHNECYCREITNTLDVQNFAKAVGSAFIDFQYGIQEVEECGLQVRCPEGLGYFFRQPSVEKHSGKSISYGNGHIAPISERKKESEDDFFRYILTWIDGEQDKGWTMHYRAKSNSASLEFQAVFSFLDEFSLFQECPEFDFETCWWRFIPFNNHENMGFTLTTYVYKEFDAHSSCFSAGLKSLLNAHAKIIPYGISFLPIQKVSADKTKRVVSVHSNTATSSVSRTITNYKYDLAISFAGTERSQAEKLAVSMRKEGFNVFYDDFYPDQLWGKDLAVHFDKIYRKESRYCVMFVSQEYANRMWTIHECRSALARSVTEKGEEYILPIKVDNTDLDGLPPSIGYISIQDYSIEKIASILTEKLKAN